MFDYPISGSTLTQMSDSPEPIHHPTLLDDYAHYRLTGDHSLEQAVDNIDAAIVWCRENNVHRLLIDISEISGFPSPSVSDRFGFATSWSASARGTVKMAMIAPAHLIDTEKIGVTVAQNRGFMVEAFTDESEAIRWLTRA